MSSHCTQRARYTSWTVSGNGHRALHRARREVQDYAPRLSTRAVEFCVIVDDRLELIPLLLSGEARENFFALDEDDSGSLTDSRPIPFAMVLNPGLCAYPAGDGDPTCWQRLPDASSYTCINSIPAQVLTTKLGEKPITFEPLSGAK